MKKGWQTKRLGDVCEIIKGRKPALKATATNGDLPYLVAKVMRGSKEAEYASVKDRNSISVEESETIIICDGSNSGEVFTGFRGILSSTMGKIAKKAEIDDDYLRAFLASTFDVFNGAKTGAAIPHLDKEAMYQLQFPFPPLAEQQRIVGLLDEAFAGLATAKANAEKNLQNARALFESHLQSVFTQRGPGWVEKTLGDLCSIARGGSPRPIQRFLTTASDGFNWVKIGDATASGKYIYTTEQKIIREGATRSRIVHAGDFLLSNSMSFGRPYIMQTTGCVHDGWLVLSDYSSQLDQDYLYLVLGSQFMFQQFDRLAAGSTVRNLNIELASRVVVPVPPLKQQRDISQHLEALSEETQHLARLYERKHAALKALKKSLLHQAFTGEL